MKIKIEVPDGTRAIALIGVYEDENGLRLGANLMDIEDCEVIEEDEDARSDEN